MTYLLTRGEVTLVVPELKVEELAVPSIEIFRSFTVSVNVIQLAALKYPVISMKCEFVVILLFE